MTTLGVHSEVGRLRRVILHRPDLELRRLTPRNCEELLFDDVLWVQQSRREHDAFADAIRDRGAEVLYLEVLLAEVLKDDAARDWVVDQTLRSRNLDPTATALVREHLDGFGPVRLADVLIGGLTAAEAGLPHRSLWLAGLDAREFVLPPLPNSYFMRDSSAWAYDGVIVSQMARSARKPEVVHTQAIYQFHPLFADEPFTFWRELDDGTPGTIEGGDVLVPGRGVVLCGLSERTTASAIDALARRLFAAEVAHIVIAVELPRRRSTMHLDTVLTMADVDTLVAFPGVMEDARAWVLRPGDIGEVAIQPEADPLAALSRALGLDDLRVLTTGGDDIEMEREQWDDGNNVLALAPGVVVAYDRNVDTNTKLRKAGIEVVTVPGAELSHGRGGPRCMSCPIVREGI